jgi:hypothetical protein
MSKLNKLLLLAGALMLLPMLANCTIAEAINNRHNNAGDGIDPDTIEVEDGRQVAYVLGVSGMD